MYKRLSLGSDNDDDSNGDKDDLILASHQPCERGRTGPFVHMPRLGPG